VTRTLEFLPTVLEEAENATRWYAERNQTAALAFAAELDHAAAEIQRAPEMWPSFEHGTRRLLLKRFPYSIVYRIDPDRLVVVAIMHARRRPGYWRGRVS
jgi:plasmid stabilization system protein ParE